MCQAFQFRHLPEEGGLNKQHPILMERFIYIMEEQAAWEKMQENQKNRGKAPPVPKNA